MLTKCKTQAMGINNTFGYMHKPLSQQCELVDLHPMPKLLYKQVPIKENDRRHKWFNQI